MMMSPIARKTAFGRKVYKAQSKASNPIRQLAVIRRHLCDIRDVPRFEHISRDRISQPVQFEIADPTREAVGAWIDQARLSPESGLFPKLTPQFNAPLSTRKNARYYSQYALINFQDLLEGVVMNDVKPLDPKSPPANPKPRIVAGILTSVLVTPFLAGIGLSISSGAISTPFAILSTSIAVLFLLAFPAHFFVGHRLQWILPALVAVMGLVSVGVGIGTSNGRMMMIGFGVPLSIIGIVWSFPHRLPAPLGQWIVKGKAFLNQRVLTKR
jgi:hypothetical protein